MKIKLELFGASRDLSKKDYLEIEIHNEASIEDLRNEIFKYLDKNFNGDQNLVKIIESSVFCSEKDEIVGDNYKIKNDQKIAIIPPIGGG